VGEPLQIAQVLYGQLAFNATQGNLKAALALGEQLLNVAHRQQDSTLSLVAHVLMGSTLLWLGEFSRAQAHCDQAFALYDSERHRDLTYHIGQDMGVTALVSAAEALWYRGYPDQALDRVRQALSLTQVLSHPLSLVTALGHLSMVHLFRREGQDAQAQAEALLTLTHEHGFAQWLAYGMSVQGWALIECTAQAGAQKQREAGFVHIREGLAAWQAAGGELWSPLFLGSLAQGYAYGGQAQEGLKVIAEALAMVEKNEERWHEAELYRIKGELLLQQAREQAIGKGE
jgi:tetratricopeptide (TPR) repeat protein